MTEVKKPKKAKPVSTELVIPHLNAYSTVSGSLPDLVNREVPLVLVPLHEVQQVLNKVMAIRNDPTHTGYQNEMYVNFLLRKIGLL